MNLFKTIVFTQLHKKLFLCIDLIFGQLEHKFERILFVKRNHIRNVRRFQTVKAGIEITKKVQIQRHISIGIRSLHQNGIWVGIRILTSKKIQILRLQNFAYWILVIAETWVSVLIKPYHFCYAQEPFVNPYKWASLFGVSKTSSGVLY